MGSPRNTKFTNYKNHLPVVGFNKTHFDLTWHYIVGIHINSHKGHKSNISINAKCDNLAWRRIVTCLKLYSVARLSADRWREASCQATNLINQKIWKLTLHKWIYSQVTIRKIGILCFPHFIKPFHSDAKYKLVFGLAKYKLILGLANKQRTPIEKVVTAISTLYQHKT